MTSDIANPNVTSAYEYLLKAHDGFLAEQHRIAERASRLVVVFALLFAALSYGASRLIQAVEDTGCDVWFWISVAFGSTAAFFLAVSFLAAMVCSRVKAVNLPNTEGLAQRVSGDDFRKSDHTSIIAGLAKNVADANATNRERQRERRRWAKLLDWTPQVGFLATAIFVAITVARAAALAAANENSATL